MQKPLAYINWSGGKDAAFALHLTLQQNDVQVGCLLTSMNTTYNRISMHGVRRELLQAQAKAIGLPLQTIELPEQPDMAEYETAMVQKVTALKNEGYSKAIFGDIFLEDLKAYREQQLAKAGIVCLFPLWKQNTKDILKRFLQLGFKAIVVCINEQYVDKSFCGRIIDESFINDLPSAVDACGENGEFHTFVFDGPIFQQPVSFTKGEIVYRQYKAPQANNNNNTSIPNYGFYFCDLLPALS